MLGLNWVCVFGRDYVRGLGGGVFGRGGVGVPECVFGLGGCISRVVGGFGLEDEVGSGSDMWTGS